MLVLSRKPGESLIIGGTIRVEILGVSGNRVRIGVEAPVHLAVDREEIHVAKRAKPAFYGRRQTGQP